MKDDSSLAAVVGQNTYKVWTSMLQALVPDGRTHRLAPMIAGMLRYAFKIAEEKYGDNPEEDTAAYSLIQAGYADDPDEVAEYLAPLLTRLFQDAGVEYARTSSQGEDYSIIENVVEEFYRWFNMPWEV